jgi:hypothetical protein
LKSLTPIDFVTETLRRTPGRPMAIYGPGRAAEALGDSQTARPRYTEFLNVWKDPDNDRPELAAAQRYLKVGQSTSRWRSAAEVGGASRARVATRFLDEVWVNESG